jgi:ubiquinone/menaquinone biosynthesis C-methylase UbiE
MQDKCTQAPIELVGHAPVEFDALAPNYDALLDDPVRSVFAKGSEFFHRRKWDLIRTHLTNCGRDSRYMSWLDVGCGRGELLSLGASYFGTAAGCDPSREMIRHGREPVLLQPDLHKLPFKSDSFDFVTAVCVFHHVEVEFLGQLIAEAFRVLRPNGLLCVIEHNPFNPVVRWIVSRTPVDREAHLMAAHQVEEQLEATGFQALETKYFLYLPERLYKRLSRFEALLQRFPLGGQYAVWCCKSLTRER